MHEIARDPAHVWGTRLPVLLMTGYTMNEDAQATLRLGALAIIQKPIALHTLRAAI
ncbi:MAG: response regulator [Myxococcales bacterium]|nr:response regulator [Myxococcales bacterium]